MSGVLLLFGVLIVVLFLGVPIGASLLLAAIVYIFSTGNLNMANMVISRVFSTVDNFSLLAVPCFIFAGNLMVKGGISRRLIGFIRLILGRTPASLASITVGASAFFGAISGSNAATVSAIGGIMIPEMEKEGYPSETAAAVAASASTLGVIIPPSVPMVTYAIIAGCSVGTMFIAGVVPGLILAAALILTNIITKAKYETTRIPRPTLRQFWKAFKDAFLALMMPVIIMGTIYGGVCTPTEAAAISCAYGLIVSVFVYKELKLKDCIPILVDSAISSAAILFVIGASMPFQWVMSSKGMDVMIANGIMNTFHSKFLILLVINVLLLFMGCFLETSAIMLLTVPVLMPIANMIGLSPIALGIIIVVNTSIGMITPPMAVCLFTASKIAKIPIERISRHILLYLVVETAVLLLFTYVPSVITFLPSLLGYSV